MKLRIVVILAALLLLVVVVGWFLAGDDSISTARRPAEGGPPPVPPAASSASATPVVQSAPPAAAPPAASAAPGPMTQPFLNSTQQSRPGVPPAMAGRAGASQNAPTSPAPPPSVSPDAAEAVARDLDQANLMLRDFRTLMGTNPVGTNAEIMKAVMGGNAKGATLGPPEGQSLNGNGELVDRWGTPYFFHQMTATHMEIHSAGPDKTFGTLDDIIQR